MGQIPYNFPYKPNSQVDGYVGVGPEGKKTRAAGALYNFGYGLSYTTFEYSDLRLSSKSIMPGENVEVSFEVTNTGKYKGDEIVQLYTHDVASSITVFERMLRGFERITLEPGETKTVTMTLTPKDFTMLDRNMKPVIEPGFFEIYVGASSVDIRLGEDLTIKDPADPDKVFKTSDSPLADRLPVTLKEGDEFIIPVNQNVEVKKFDIQWRLDSNCTYEVLLNLGGGQFNVELVMETTGGMQKPRFTGAFKASDIMIRVVKGQGTITHFDCLSL